MFSGKWKNASTKKNTYKKLCKQFQKSIKATIMIGKFKKQEFKCYFKLLLVQVLTRHKKKTQQRNRNEQKKIIISIIIFMQIEHNKKKKIKNKEKIKPK